MRVLVTGGYGFIGARLVRELSNAGHYVRIGSRQRMPVSTSPHAQQVVQLDWGAPESLAAACDGIEVVVHTSGMNASDCLADPIGALECNGLATARLVHAAIRAGVRRFIYMSTAHVYGSPLTGLLDEQTCPRNLHPYATSHIAGESVVMHAASKGDLEGVVLRLSNACGAPATLDVNCWMLLFNDLCREAVRQRSLTLRTDANQRRDFISMIDVVRAIIWLANIHGKVGQGIINLSSGQSMTLLDIAQIIQWGCKKTLGYLPVLNVPLYSHSSVDQLAIKVDKLLATGFELKGGLDVEVRNSLIQYQAAMTSHE
jgi:UDP-glucose 4-epimerase